MKADGTRKFGYGLDVIRAWCAFKDSDRNLQVTQIEAVNKEVKLYRDVLKVLLHHLQGFDPSQAMLGPSLFKDLTFVDGMMMVKLLDFSNRVTEAFDKFDLAAVYNMTQRFLVDDVSEFYLDFTKYRRRRLASDSPGTLGVLYHLANTLIVTTAPILCLTSQEAFEHLPLADRPPTVFQLPWPQQTLRDAVDARFLAKFEQRERFALLLDLRSRLRALYEEQGVLDAVSKRSYQRTALHFVVDAVDSEEASLLETLEGEDLEDFFFGVHVVVETREQNARRKRPPIKSAKWSIGEKCKFTVRVYQNQAERECRICKKVRHGDVCE